MQILVANDIGFCFGVKRAIETAKRTREKHGANIYTLGELIHNATVINSLKDEGIIPVDDISQLNPDDVLVIRSHGAAKSVFDECTRLGINAVDATCPFVKKIQNIAFDESSRKKAVIITGDKNHPEVKGIVGNCADGAETYVISTAEEATELLKTLTSPAILVSQTTFMRERFDEIAQIFYNSSADVKIYSTVCDTTINRQREAEELSKRCTKMIIIGGKNSSNTKKLAEICSNNCKYIICIENTCALSLDIFEKNDIIGLVAGASTPDLMIREVITTMNEQELMNAGIETEAQETSAAPAKKEAVVITDDMTFAEAFEALDNVRVSEGKSIGGIVYKVAPDEVIVTIIGYKTEGVLPRAEYSSDSDVDLTTKFTEGQEIKARVKKVNNGKNQVLLTMRRPEREGRNSYKPSEVLQDPDLMEKVYEATVKEASKSGLVAFIKDLRVFVPASQVSDTYVSDLNDYVDKTIRVKVIEVKGERKSVIASAREVIVAEREQEKREFCNTLEVGQKINGTVKRFITAKGDENKRIVAVSVDLGHSLTARLGAPDVSWARTPVNEILKEGQEIEVLILTVDKEKVRVSVGYKQLQPKPWATAEERYPVGTVVECTVSSVQSYGAFVDVEPTIRGLIPISQIGVDYIPDITEVVKPGDKLRCKVTEISSKERRITLSRKDVILEENPEIAERIARQKEEREAKRAEIEQQRKERAARAEAAQQARRERREAENAERHTRREDEYKLPDYESATTSLASLFAGIKIDDDEE